MPCAELVVRLWALAVAIDDAGMTDAEKALRAAQEALKQALERNASDEEISGVSPTSCARRSTVTCASLPSSSAEPAAARPSARSEHPRDAAQDLRATSTGWSVWRAPAIATRRRQMLEQLQQMLENLQMAQPGMRGDDEMEQALNELSHLARKQQQLSRDRTFQQGQDFVARPHARQRTIPTR